MLHVLTIVLMILSNGVASTHTYRMQYDTQFTCDEALSEINTDAIEKWYDSKHKKSRVQRVKATCERQFVPDSRDCSLDWNGRCSDALMVS
jgi:hypothetical protein